MQLDAYKHEVQVQHDNTETPPMRWGHCSLGVFRPDHGGCFNSAQQVLHSYQNEEFNYNFQTKQDDIPVSLREFMHVICHGDGVVHDLKSLTNEAVFNQRTIEYTRPFNKFEGTERSLRWITFLLSPENPWKDLIPFFAETDASYINNAGFIFKDGKTLPAKLYYNFLMAVRFPWEQPRQYSTFLLLVDKGVPANEALFISNLCALREGATDLEDGPWDVVYPWSFLETMHLAAAGRFILAKPATVAPKEDCSPNVGPLWLCHSSQEKEMLQATEQMGADEKLSLSSIRETVAAAVEIQKGKF